MRNRNATSFLASLSSLISLEESDEELLDELLDEILELSDELQQYEIPHVRKAMGPHPQQKYAATITTGRKARNPRYFKFAPPL